jgi:uncharacterized tellurite resistance protein B-like protein
MQLTSSTVEFSRQVVSSQHLAVLKKAADHVAKRALNVAKEMLADYLGNLSPAESPEDLQCHIFANALFSRMGDKSSDANLYLRDYDVSQIRLFNLLATRFPPVTLASATAIEILARKAQGRRKLVVLDIGIGTGRQMAAFIDRLARLDPAPEQLVVIGLEPMPAALNEAEKLIHQTGRQAGIAIDFWPLPGLVEELPDTQWERIRKAPGDLLINASFAVHHIRGLPSGPEPRARLFRKLHTLHPLILVLSEPNSDHHAEDVTKRLENSWSHFGLVFGLIDELDISLADQRALKICFFGREIEDILGMKERDRTERHEALETWESRLNRNGFISNLPEGVAAALSHPLVRLNRSTWHIGLEYRGETVVGVIGATPTGKIADEPWPRTEPLRGYQRDEEGFEPRAYLSALVRIALADEHVHPAARDFIEQQARLFGVEAAETWRLADYCRGRELPPLTRRNRLALVRDCKVVANLDGEYGTRERAKVQQIAGRLNLTSGEIAEAEEDARICMPPFRETSPVWLREYWGILEKGE